MFFNSCGWFHFSLKLDITHTLTIFLNLFTKNKNKLAYYLTFLIDVFPSLDNIPSKFFTYYPMPRISRNLVSTGKKKDGPVCVRRWGGIRSAGWGWWEERAAVGSFARSRAGRCRRGRRSGQTGPPRAASWPPSRDGGSRPPPGRRRAASGEAGRPRRWLVARRRTGGTRWRRRLGRCTTTPAEGTWAESAVPGSGPLSVPPACRPRCWKLHRYRIQYASGWTKPWRQRSQILPSGPPMVQNLPCKKQIIFSMVSYINENKNCIQKNVKQISKVKKQKKILFSFLQRGVHSKEGSIQENRKMD